MIDTDKISGSLIYQEYQKYKFVPSIDTLLDWRRSLEDKKANDSINPSEWYDMEILATDYLLSLCTC